MTDPVRKPLDEKEVLIHVPKGTSSHVRIVESDPEKLGNEITVQVSKKRPTSALSVVGVIVK
ncbi:hypothetical protein [Chromobacterium sphagni]|uniref:hypothetical protein n=1 Tax=Chromobacterium sphagni TaxID=1903179 RepID=UPI001113D2BE|nr:hypothetical protein [Chromobacterium sphagni]